MTINTRRLGLGAVLALLGLAAAACGGSGSASTRPASAGPAAAGGTIAAASSPLGRILVAGDGMTLYMFARDPAGTSACSGGCTSIWPPYTAPGTPNVGSGLKASLLGTTVRADGSTQVTYDGHPLYTYAGDPGPGDTNGQGVDDFGAHWWVVAPDGQVVLGSAHSGSGVGGY